MNNMINIIGEYIGKCKREFKHGFNLGYTKVNGAIQSTIETKDKKEV